MIKQFCDHCGKEIVDMKERYEMDERDFPDTMEIGKFLNKELCEACYCLRVQWHLDVDEVFFHMVKEE
ncbi:MAG: hypothetical protein IJA72_02475 [Clostridia bacterium]|nr:hypothetical protein [Clostridia bacterium]